MSDILRDPDHASPEDELTVDAAIENLNTVLAFVDERLEALGCPPKAQIQIEVAVEELFVNIAHYAYGGETGKASLRFEKSGDPLSVSLTFTDGGKPYDPLAKEDPDVTLGAEERPIGGLGIFMVKKSMDEMKYAYADGKNILTIRKVLI